MDSKAINDTVVSEVAATRKNDYVSFIVSIIAIYVISKLMLNLYDTFYGPLSKFPGPKLNALSILPFSSMTWKGCDNLVIPALHQEYGRVVRTGPNQLSFIGDGQTWKDIYGFRKANQPEVKKPRYFYGLGINRTPGIINADYETHARQRKIVSHAFGDKALREQEPMLKRWALMLRDKLSEFVETGERIDMLKMYNCTTFDIMGDLTFAEPLYMLRDNEYGSWVKTIFGGVKYGSAMLALKMLGRHVQWLIEEIMFKLPAAKEAMLKHWKYTSDRVDRRLASDPDRPDLWTRILEKGGRPHDRPMGEGLSLDEHYSIASIFMIAGTETTATALSGTTYWLLRNPKYLQRLQAELRESFASFDDIRLDTMVRIPFLEAVLKEGIRMYPPVPIGLPRVSPPGGMMIGKDYVPEGTIITIHQLSTYRSPKNFKFANEFRPERWLGDPEFKEDKLDAFEPFSVGPKNCLGKNLAWHEMRLLLSTVLYHFDVELAQESLNWADQKVYILWEKPELICRLRQVR